MAEIITIAHTRLIALTAAMFEKAGAPPANAMRAAEGLAGANLAGHDSHGVVRLPRYLQAIAQGHLKAAAHAAIVKDSGALLVIDGGSGFGMVIGREAMQAGIARAGQHGVCLVAIRRSFHLGRIGEWAEQCAAAGFASVHFVNILHAGGIAAPFGGRDRRMSTNPFAAGMPMPGGEPVILDMATTKIAEGKALVALHAGKKVPEGALMNAQGRATREPADLYADPPGALLHFGEHKGYGLALICELFAGALTGGGANSPLHPAEGTVHNNMLSIIIDPDFAGDGGLVGREASVFIDWMRECAPLDPEAPVLVAGDPERRSRAVRLAQGVPLDMGTWKTIVDAALPLGLSRDDIARLSGVSA